MIPQGGFRTKRIWYDPYWDNVSLLLNMNGADGGTTFTDLSTNEHSITAAYITTRTAQKKFGTASALLTGTLWNESRLSFADSDTWNFGSGAFTLEFFIRFTALPASGSAMAVFSHGISNNRSFDLNLRNYSGIYKWDFIYSTTGTNYIYISFTHAVSINTWYHIRCGRSGNTLSMHADGSSLGTGALSATIYNCTGPFVIGAEAYYHWDSSILYRYPLKAYLDEVRVTKGVSRPVYVPTSEYPAMR